ncbi:hypothetical protein MUK72_09190 [Halococcus dombrowskii]|uniref:Uncharacterized protein n=1 Tax=Halococcus dombrowskii TaxID=179637 RepID=A0AAV3SDV8_HALDO|nr:hypothetical protein [Halococcus dombrowskii]UOO94144.1 hypothetical protein MUK72_09190 [Halococcus dombrowskii]
MNADQAGAILKQMFTDQDMDEFEEGMESEELTNSIKDNTETEELSKTMTESTIVFDEEAGEMKLKEVAADKEEELSEDTEDTEIEELRKVYENYESAGSAWEKAADKARGELMAALKEEKADVDDEIDDLRSYSSDDEKTELKQERRSLNSEIEELAR